MSIWIWKTKIKKKKRQREELIGSQKGAMDKLKLIKSYLRSTMSQEKLSGLAILSIEKEMLAKLECKNLISNFASQKVRKINFNWKNIYEFIIKYNKRPHLKVSPRAPKFIQPALYGDSRLKFLQDLKSEASLLIGLVPVYRPYVNKQRKEVRNFIHI